MSHRAAKEHGHLEQAHALAKRSRIRLKPTTKGKILNNKNKHYT